MGCSLGLHENRDTQTNKSCLGKSKAKTTQKAAEHLIKFDLFSPDALQCILKAFADKPVRVLVSAQSLSLSDESADEDEDCKGLGYLSRLLTRNRLLTLLRSYVDQTMNDCDETKVVSKPELIQCHACKSWQKC